MPEFDSDRIWREQMQPQVDAAYLKIRKMFGDREFTFDELTQLGVTYQDANYILQTLKDKGKIITVGFKTFKCKK